MTFGVGYRTQLKAVFLTLNVEMTDTIVVLVSSFVRYIATKLGEVASNVIQATLGKNTTWLNLIIVFKPYS